MSDAVVGACGDLYCVVCLGLVHCILHRGAWLPLDQAVVASAAVCINPSRRVHVSHTADIVDRRRHLVGVMNVTSYQHLSIVEYLRASRQPGSNLRGVGYVNGLHAREIASPGDGSLGGQVAAVP